MRKIYVVAAGVKSGNGKVVMGMDYYLAVSDSEAEANMLKKMDEIEVQNNGK